MPEINTVKCVDYPSFIQELNTIHSEIQSGESTIDADKVNNWINNNWNYLRQGHSEKNQDLKGLETRLRTLAEHDTAAKRILATFTQCVAEASYFEIAPQAILTHTTAFMDQADRSCLYKSHISENTDLMVETVFVNELNKGLPLNKLDLPDEAIESFLKRHSESIKHLNLSYLSKDQAVKFAPLCPNLIELHLNGCSLDSEALCKILNAQKFSFLQTLNLAKNGFGERGARVIAESKNFKQVQHLNLTNNKIGEAGARALAESKTLRQLRHLNLCNNGLGKNGAIALARSAILEKVLHLDLSSNNLEAEGASALAASEYLKQVLHLDLSCNNLRAEGAIALAASEYLKQVQRLDLAFNVIGDEGARALVASEYLRHVLYLNLSHNFLLEEAKAKVLNKFKEAARV